MHKYAAWWPSAACLLARLANPNLVNPNKYRAARDRSHCWSPAMLLGFTRAPPSLGSRALCDYGQLAYRRALQVVLRGTTHHQATAGGGSRREVQ